MLSRTQRLITALQNKQAVKVIAGITNTHLPHVLAVVQAATEANATAVDIASEPTIVRAVRQATDLPVFVSDIDPNALAQAASNGADVVELGNYDGLYAQGQFFSHDDVLRLTKETLALILETTLLSVTIPGHLSLDTQIRMAQELEAMGAHMIQTEGASRALATEPSVTTLSANEKAEITLNNTRVLARSTTLPVITASGITVKNATQALDMGAAGVGVGSTINQLTEVAPMVEVIQALMAQVNTHQPNVSLTA